MFYKNYFRPFSSLSIHYYLPDSTVIKQFLVYSFGSLFLKAISMLVIPLTIKELTPSDFGTLSLITSFIVIANAIIGLGLRQVVSIEYFHCSRPEEKITLINDIVIIYSCVAIPAIGCLLLWRATIVKYLFFNCISDTIFLTMLTTIFLSFFVELLYQLLQYEQQAYKLTLLQLTIASISCTLTLLFVWYYHLQILGVVTAQCCSTLLGCFVAFFGYRKIYSKNIVLHKSINRAKDLIVCGLPFIPSILFSWIMASSDRWILGYYCSMKEVGIYSVADLFAQLFYFLVLQPWAGAYLPYIMSQYNAHKNDLISIEKNNLKTMYYCMGITGVCIFMSTTCLKSILLHIVPSMYADSIYYISILLYGQLFLLGSYFASSYIQYHKKSIFLACALGIPAMCNVILNAILIPKYSVLGASYTTLFSYVLYWLIIVQYNKYLQAKNSKIELTNNQSLAST